MTGPVQWQLRAACKGHLTDMWFPEHAKGQEAKDICIKRCPVRRSCGLDAVRRKERWAIAAGFKTNAPEERAELRRWLDLPPERMRSCGSCGEPVTGNNLLCQICRGRVPLEPVGEHIVRLRAAGWTVLGIAQRAEMPLSSLKQMISAHQSSTRQYTSRRAADAIFAIHTPASAGAES